MLSFLSAKTRPVSSAEALPGRAQPIATAREHFVNHRKLAPPYPAGIETAVFGMGCFWGAERKFWQAGEGVWVTAVGYAGGFTPNPTYEETCSGRTGHAEVVLVAYDPAKIAYEALLKLFWENHDPTQGMRQGADVGTQYRSAIYCDDARAGRGGAPFGRDVRRGAEGQGPRRDHHRDRRSGAVLFRRGLPPAISGQESRRLLRPRRHRRLLPDRAGRRNGVERAVALRAPTGPERGSGLAARKDAAAFRLEGRRLRLLGD